MNIKKNPWLKSCESFYLDEKDGSKYLTAYLYHK